MTDPRPSSRPPSAFAGIELAALAVDRRDELLTEPSHPPIAPIYVGRSGGAIVLIQRGPSGVSVIRVHPESIFKLSARLIVCASDLSD